MIYFTEVADKENKILFQFFDRELPEGISPQGKETKLKEIQYPGGFQTNQIIGVYLQPVEWTGLFYGTYTIDGKKLTAKDRADMILGEGSYVGRGLMGRPLRVGFPVPGHSAKGNIPGETMQLDTTSNDIIGGPVGEYIIKSFVPTIKNYFEVEYSITLVPHQRQEKIRPTETTSVKITTNFNNVKTAGSSVQAKADKTKNKAIAKAKKSGKAAETVANKATPKAPATKFGNTGFNKTYNSGSTR